MVIVLNMEKFVAIAGKKDGVCRASKKPNPNYSVVTDGASVLIIFIKIMFKLFLFQWWERDMSCCSQALMFSSSIWSERRRCFYCWWYSTPELLPDNIAPTFDLILIWIPTQSTEIFGTFCFLQIWSALSTFNSSVAH